MEKPAESIKDEPSRPGAASDCLSLRRWAILKLVVLVVIVAGMALISKDTVADVMGFGGAVQPGSWISGLALVWAAIIGPGILAALPVAALGALLVHAAPEWIEPSFWAAGLLALVVDILYWMFLIRSFGGCLRMLKQVELPRVPE